MRCRSRDWRRSICVFEPGGDHRVSNFLLWQLGYAELMFTDVLWPAFNAQTLDAALAEFGLRERRFGVRAATSLVGSLATVGETE